jgi:hypothetical protein
MQKWDEIVLDVKSKLPYDGEVDYRDRINEIALDYWRAQFGPFGKLMMPAALMMLSGLQKPPFVDSPPNPDTMSIRFKTAKERELVKRSTTAEERGKALLDYARWKISNK